MGQSSLGIRSYHKEILNRHTVLEHRLDKSGCHIKDDAGLLMDTLSVDKLNASDDHDSKMDKTRQNCL